MKTFQPSAYSFSPVQSNPDQAWPGAPTATPVPDQKPSALGIGLTAGGLALLGGILLFPTFVVTPWIIKQFKPEWPYTKRLATGFVVNMGISTALALTRAAAGKK